MHMTQGPSLAESAVTIVGARVLCFRGKSVRYLLMFLFNQRSNDFVDFGETGIQLKPCFKF